MRLLLAPLFMFVIFITNPRPSKKLKINLSIVFIFLAWLNVYLLYSNLNPGYFEISAGALYILSTICLGTTLKKKIPPLDEIISFNCPFCLNNVEFDIIDKDKSKKCPECNEILTVTTDEEVHRATIEARKEILDAMESEDLQEDPENLVEPSMAGSVLGFQFELKKDNNSPTSDMDEEKEE